MSDASTNTDPVPDQEPTDETAENEPTAEQLQKPSTETEPGEEPKAAKPHDSQPSHHAVGIGVIENSDFEEDTETD